ncbi:kinase-like protein [Trichocladium antarcticum]|uniref:Kinase-like protein n=1 Tax=Trichocladium antarcticum TaxID=1450529 RepID=A0AAN6ZBA3_9PEZI|nr:kinase-like protein [Trichocladium antarcticum]
MDDGYFDDDVEPSPGPVPPCFVLAPLNPAARKVVDHVRNNDLRCRVDNTIGLWVDFSCPTKLVYTLGQAENDIHLPNPRSSSKGSPHISPVHASFQIVPETGAVLLWDHSDKGSVEPLSGSHSFTVKFRSNSKSVLIARGINSRIALGDDRWYQFEIQWKSDGLYDFPNKDEPYTMGPSSSRSKKYVLGERVGGGSYGTVWWVLDAANGKIMAVKKFHNMSGKNLEFATREVANLFRINKDSSIKHEHILQILAYAGGGESDNWGEIFMPLMKGNLKVLIENGGNADNTLLSDVVLRQMLLALQCIASHNIIHRDVKPENILWEYDESGEYCFRLGDFGLSNDPGLARTAAGTEPFMAPEVYHRQKQTTKVDIWSLFATIVWMRTQEFRTQCSQYRAPELHLWLFNIAKLAEYARMRQMASMEPAKRPSASTQLAILDGRFGDYGSVASYGSGDELADDLSGRFGRVMNLGTTPGLTYGSGSSDAVTSPELPYYEPYASRLMEDIMNAKGGAASKRYAPPDLPSTPRDQGVSTRAYLSIPLQNQSLNPACHRHGSCRMQTHTRRRTVKTAGAGRRCPTRGRPWRRRSWTRRWWCTTKVRGGGARGSIGHRT